MSTVCLSISAYHVTVNMQSIESASMDQMSPGRLRPGEDCSLVNTQTITRATFKITQLKDVEVSRQSCFFIPLLSLCEEKIASIYSNARCTTPTCEPAATQDNNSNYHTFQGGKKEILKDYIVRSNPVPTITLPEDCFHSHRSPPPWHIKSWHSPHRKQPLMSPLGSRRPSFRNPQSFTAPPPIFNCHLILHSFTDKQMRRICQCGDSLSLLENV